MGDGLAKQSPNYIDLVVLKDAPMLCQAPAFSNLKAGDTVVVKTPDCFMTRTVERVYTAKKKGDDLDFILSASGQELPLPKVLKKVIYKDFEYEDEVLNEQSGIESKT